ncbi:dihydrofolate reductase [Salibacterium halotolerans]|uniref:Dihydrofolate reductase n=1 Tax=Salibacterium halotolerans TaxID=1884432 RepID=A0A1I5QXC4_9BACI|nr:dihydrofolate reductase [Salibacterium halotolerans]SFP50747.1 dihydrofolate reductase [Salibacterium halotolerans]
MISFVAAMDENRVIGLNGSMPWHLPNDLKHFKQVTYGAPVIMGRKTFESIGKALPGRQNIILTSNPSLDAAGCELVHTVEEVKVLGDGDEEKEWFVIGGEALFEELLPHASRMHLTIIHEHFNGDTYFPPWEEKDWHVVCEEQGHMDEKNKHPHTFLTLERKQ